MPTRTVHLIAGQSNARGAANKAALTDTRYDFTQPDVRQWTRLDGSNSSTTSTAMSIPSGLFSIEAAYGRQLNVTSGQLPIIFRAGWSGTSLFGTWRPKVATAEWDNATAHLWACYEAAKTEFIGDDFEFGSLVWIQGEADSQSTQRASEYQGNLEDLIEVYRREFGANLPVVLVQLSENLQTVGGLENPGDLDVMRAAYVAAAASQGNCAVVDATPVALQGDNTHYTADGYMDLGDRCFTAYQTLTAGTQHIANGRAFTSELLAQTFADLAQTTHGDRDENPANGGFGVRLGPAARDPWPTTPRNEAVEKHPFFDRWYVPTDGVMAAGALNTLTNSRPLNLDWVKVLE